MGKTYEAIQVQVAEAQLRIMVDQEKHMKEMRRMELQKAQIELHTAEMLNACAKRIELAEDLPPIKLS